MKYYFGLVVVVFSLAAFDMMFGIDRTIASIKSYCRRKHEDNSNN